MLNRQRQPWWPADGWAMKVKIMATCYVWAGRSGTGKHVGECPQEITKSELPSLADAVTHCYLTLQ